MKRGLWLAGLLAIMSVGVVMLLQIFTQNLVFFYSPTELQTASISDGQRIRIGGLVKEGSIEKQENSNRVAFVVTDTAYEVNVQYEGLLPALFREGQGVVAEGYMQGEAFEAENVLTKHDENYMPPEVAKSLKAQGVWEGKSGELYAPALMKENAPTVPDAQDTP